MASSGMAAVLQVAARKGFIPNERKKESLATSKSQTVAQRDVYVRLYSLGWNYCFGFSICLNKIIVNV